MKMPTEEVLRGVESRHDINIERHFYASEEYYNAHHPEGKNTPTFSANNGLGDGKHVKLVAISGSIYVVQPTGKAIKEPIPILFSGRSKGH